jgi:hypothetical protein
LEKCTSHNGKKNPEELFNFSILLLAAILW